jgi:hypothetical protein
VSPQQSSEPERKLGTTKAPALRRTLTIAGGVAALVAALAGVVFTVARAQSGPAPGIAAPAASAGVTPSAAPGAPNAPPAQVDVQNEPPTTAPTVRIVIKVVPPNNATVTWGNKRLGLIKPKAPLIFERPRDSGPIDVVVKSQGYVTVHTRAYTFTNTVLAVKLTPVDKKNTIYGYREEVPPEADGGVPGALPSAPGAAPPGAGTPDAGAR